MSIPPVETISEAELGLVGRSKAVRRLHIVQTETRKFHLHVHLHNRGETLRLVSARKTPREWASLDSLTKRVQEMCGAVPHMTLSLYSGEAKK